MAHAFEQRFRGCGNIIKLIAGLEAKMTVDGQHSRLPESRNVMDGLAKSQPTIAAVMLIGKSPWKIGGIGVIGLSALVFVFFFVFLIRWQIAIWLTLLNAFFFYPVIFLWLQFLLVSICKKAPLVLESEGLCVNFTGDFIRYDQIVRVDYAYYVAGTLVLKLVPGVKLKFGHAPYRLGWGHGSMLGFYAMYTMPVSELASEIERRMKALSGAPP